MSRSEASSRDGANRKVKGLDMRSIEGVIEHQAMFGGSSVRTNDLTMDAQKIVLIAYQEFRGPKPAKKRGAMPS